MIIVAFSTYKTATSNVIEFTHSWLFCCCCLFLSHTGETTPTVLNEIFDENPGQSSSCSDVVQNCEVGRTPRSYSPIKVTGVLVRKFREHPQKVPGSSFMGVSPIHFHPQELPIQQQQIISLVRQIFDSNKDNFRTLSSQGLFESSVINLSPNKSYQLWQQSFYVLAP